MLTNEIEAGICTHSECNSRQANRERGDGRVANDDDSGSGLPTRFLPKPKM